MPIQQKQPGLIEMSLEEVSSVLGVYFLKPSPEARDRILSLVTEFQSKVGRMVKLKLDQSLSGRINDIYTAIGMVQKALRECGLDTDQAVENLQIIRQDFRLKIEQILKEEKEATELVEYHGKKMRRDQILFLQQLVKQISLDDLRQNRSVTDDLLSDAEQSEKLKMHEVATADMVKVDEDGFIVELDCHRKNLSALPSLPKKLQILHCDMNELITLPQLPPTLTNLKCCRNRLISLPALPPLLRWLECQSNELVVLPSLPSKLAYLDCRGNQLLDIPLEGAFPIMVHYEGNPFPQEIIAKLEEMYLGGMRRIDAVNQFTTAKKITEELSGRSFKWRLLKARLKRILHAMFS